MTIKGVVYFAVAYFNVFGSQCYPIPTWRPMHQQTRQEIPTWRHRQPQTWPEIATWHVQAWPTQPHIPDIMKPDINWTPYIVPTVSYNSERMASGIVVPAISAVLFVLFTIGVRFLCKRARPNQAHQAHVLTVPNVSTPIHEVPAALSQIEAPYVPNNNVTVDMGTTPNDINPPSYEDVCCDVTQCNADSSIPDEPPP